MTLDLSPGRRIIDVGAVAPSNALGWAGDHVSRVDLAAAYYPGTSFPAPTPVYDYRNSLRQAGAANSVGGVFTSTHMSGGDTSYLELPWLTTDILGASGFSGFVVANFIANNAMAVGQFGSTEQLDWSVHVLSTGGNPYRAVVYQPAGSGVDAVASINPDSYTGTGPETLFFNFSNTQVKLWRMKPGGTLASNAAAHTIDLSTMRANPIRIGRSRTSSQNGNIDIYGCGLRSALYANDAAVAAEYAALQTFMASHGVTI